MEFLREASRVTLVGTIKHQTGVWLRPLDELVVQYSGGGQTADMTIQVGHSTCKGRGYRQKDKLDIRAGYNRCSRQMLFGVYDGNAGTVGPDYKQNPLLGYIRDNRHFEERTKLAIRQGFARVGQLFVRKEQNPQGGYSTTTIIDSKLFIACMGDSTVTLSRRDGKVIHVSGSNLNHGGSTISNWIASKIGSYEKENPMDLKEDKIEVYDVIDIEYIVLGSKGLCKTLDKHHMIELVKQVGEPEVAAKMLVDTAYKKGSKENITCLVIKLNQGAAGAGEVEDGLIVEIEETEEEKKKKKKKALTEMMMKKVEYNDKKLEEEETQGQKVHKSLTNAGILLIVVISLMVVMLGATFSGTSNTSETENLTKVLGYTLLFWGYTSIYMSVIASVTFDYFLLIEKWLDSQWFLVTLAKALLILGIVLTCFGFREKYHSYLL